jgi:hypothetical protein
MNLKSLSGKGLSISQAQNISNICNQMALEIDHQIQIINNCSKTITIDSETYNHSTGKPIPGDIISLILRKGKLHATQAFLMENIKCKSDILWELKQKKYECTLKGLEYPLLKKAELKPEVDEKWGITKLTLTEYNEFLEVEALAAHIGQFIHKDGKLDQLREELPYISELAWFELEQGKKTPIKVTLHHTSEQLMDIHNQLAALHRKYEQRVNYFKAKITRFFFDENIKISEENNNTIDLIKKENDQAMEKYAEEKRLFDIQDLQARQLFEKNRSEDLSKYSQLRIAIDPRFQPIINEILLHIPEQEDTDGEKEDK